MAIAIPVLRQKAIAYERLSTVRQSKGDGTRRQSVTTDAWCAAHGVEIDKRFSDIGASGWTGKNATEGQLRAIMDEASASRFDPRGYYFVAENLDRISRQVPTQGLLLIWALIDLGFHVVTADDGHILTEENKNELGTLITTAVILSRGNEESNRKSDMIRKAREKRRNQVIAGETSYLTRQGPEWLKAKGSGRNFVWEKIEAHVAVVRLIFELCINGMGRFAIMTELNRRGIPSFRGNAGWHAASIRALLTNRRVLGHFQPTKLVNGKRTPTGDEIRSYYPPVISEAVFYQAAEAMAARRDPNARGAKGEGLPNVFSGLGRCGVCGGSLVLDGRQSRRRANGKREKAKYLACGNGVRDMCTNKFHYPYNALERCLIELLTNYDLTSVVGKTAEPDAQREAELEDAITGRKAEVDRLFQDGAWKSSQGAQRHIQRLEEEQTKLEAELEAHRRQLRIADANRSRNLHKEFQKLIQRMREDMPDAERFLLRVKLSSEFKRQISVIRTDGKDLVITMKTRDCLDSVDMHLTWTAPPPGGSPIEIIGIPWRFLGKDVAPFSRGAELLP
jgi:hypothetical protein